MKFKFKIQQYQTDAVERTVEVFEGQPSMDSLTYRRDLGKRASQTSILDDEIETGYRNCEIQLLPKEILANIRKAQAAGDIKLSDSLVLLCSKTTLWSTMARRLVGLYMTVAV